MAQETLVNWTHESRLMTLGFSLGATVVYSYMLSRFTWFRDESKDYFESQESIEKATGISLRSVKAHIKELSEGGLLTITKIGGGKHLRNKYFVVDRFGTYKNLPQKVKKPRAIPKMQQVEGVHPDPEWLA